MTNETSENTGEPVDQGTQQTPAAPSPPPVSAPAPQEKMIPQSEVNGLVGSAKLKGAAKAADEWREELKQQMATFKREWTDELQSQAGTKTEPTPNTGDVPNIEDVVNKALEARSKVEQETAQKQHYDDFVKKQYAELETKVTEGKTAYPDFEEVVKTAQFDQDDADILMLTNCVENSADVIYHLAQNPLQIGALKSLSPERQIQALKKLGGSISTNVQAKSVPRLRNPVSSISPSPITGNTGVTSLQALKARAAKLF